MKDVPIFRSFSEEFLVSLIEQTTCELFIPGVVVAEEGSIANRMWGECILDSSSKYFVINNNYLPTFYHLGSFYRRVSLIGLRSLVRACCFLPQLGVVSVIVRSSCKSVMPQRLFLGHFVHVMCLRPKSVVLCNLLFNIALVC